MLRDIMHWEVIEGEIMRNISLYFSLYLIIGLPLGKSHFSHMLHLHAFANSAR